MPRRFRKKGKDRAVAPAPWTVSARVVEEGWLITVTNEGIVPATFNVSSWELHHPQEQKLWKIRVDSIGPTRAPAFGDVSLLVRFFGPHATAAMSESSTLTLHPLNHAPLTVELEAHHAQ